MNSQHPQGTTWFCATPQGNRGPFREDQMMDFLGREVITPETYIWRDGYTNWITIQESGDFDAFLKVALGNAAPAPQAGEQLAAQPAQSQQPQPQQQASAQAQSQQHLNPQASASQQPQGQQARAGQGGAGQAFDPAASQQVLDSMSQDDALDEIFGSMVKESWRRYRIRQLATEVDEVLVGGVITSVLDNGYSLIDLGSDGQNHMLRFEKLENGDRVIFQLRHLAEQLITAKVLGHEAQVTIGFGRRIRDFSKVWNAIKQEIKGGYIASPDPGIITIDGDISSQYIYVQVNLLWDIEDYLDDEDPYTVLYPKLTQDVGATLHALRKYLVGRFGDS